MINDKLIAATNEENETIKWDKCLEWILSLEEYVMAMKLYQNLSKTKPLNQQIISYQINQLDQTFFKYLQNKLKLQKVSTIQKINDKLDKNDQISQILLLCLVAVFKHPA